MFLNEFRGLYADECETRNSDKRWKKHRASVRFASCSAKTTKGVLHWGQRQTWLRRVECGPLTQTFLTDVRISFLAASHSQQKLQDQRDAQWEYGASCKSWCRKGRQATQSTDINVILLGENGSASDLNQPSGCDVGTIWVSPLWANETRRGKKKAQNVINIYL